MNSPRPPDQLCSNRDLDKLWDSTIKEAVRASYQEYKVLEACKRGQISLAELVAARERKATAHASLKDAARKLRRLGEDDIS